MVPEAVVARDVAGWVLMHVVSKSPERAGAIAGC